MNFSKPAAASKRHAAKRAKARINLYPLLGIVLAIVLALLTYGGIYLYLS